MNETIRIIEERFSCRSFTDEVITDEQLKTIAKAANHSPSARNIQPWRIIVLKDKSLMDELETEGLNMMKAMLDKSLYERIQSRGGKLFYNAQSMIFIPINKTESDYALMDCGIVCENVAIAAKSLGVDSCICGLAGIPFAGENSAHYKAKLGFPEGFEFGIAILLGHAVEPVAPHEQDDAKISFI